MFEKIKATVQSEEFKFQAKLFAQSVAIGVVTSLAVSAVGLAASSIDGKFAELKESNEVED